jgi:hypothetical protein
MRSNAWPERALAILVAVSLEAAWLELAYVTVQGITRGVVAIPLVAFAAAALAGLGVARWAARRPDVPYAPVLGTAVVAAAVLGWLVPMGPAAVDALASPVASLERHLAGLLLGVAVLRGAVHAGLDDEERIAGRALGPGLAGVAVLWLLLVASDAVRVPWILDPAFSATVTYVGSALLAIGLARLADPRDEGALRAHRRTWIALLVLVVVGLFAVAIPLALVIGAPAESAVRGVLGPVGDVVVAVAALALLPLAVIGALLVEALTFIRDTFDLGAPGAVIGQLADEARRLVGGSSAEGSPFGFFVVILALVAALVALRVLLRRPEAPAPAGVVAELREPEPPATALPWRRPRLRRRRRAGDPRTASEAYLASVALLEGAAAARHGSETPAEHARRLREDPLGAPLGRLAADYALAEFGGRALPAAEHRRAIERWRRIRTLRNAPRPR